MCLSLDQLAINTACCVQPALLSSRPAVVPTLSEDRLRALTSWDQLDPSLARAPALAPASLPALQHQQQQQRQSSGLQPQPSGLPPQPFAQGERSVLAGLCIPRHS